MKTSLKLAQAKLETFEAGLDFVLGSGSFEVVGTPTSFIERVLNFLVTFAAIVTVGVFIWGAFLYITSLGDETKSASAKKIMFYAIIGLVVIMLSYVAIRFVGNLLGVG